MKTYKCVKCIYASAKKFSVTRHMRNVHKIFGQSPEDVTYRYSCTKCHFEDNSLETVKIHQIRTHWIYYPPVEYNKKLGYICSLCHYNPVQRRKLLRHIWRIHHRPTDPIHEPMSGCEELEFNSNQGVATADDYRSQPQPSTSGQHSIGAILTYL